MKKLLMVVAVMALAGMVRADLTFTNGDFEAQTVTDGGNNRNIADWYEMTQSPAWDDFVLLSTEKHGDNETVVASINAGYLYQSLGTITDETSLKIGGMAIKRNGYYFAPVDIEVFAGSFVGAADGVDISTAGLTSLGTYTITNEGLTGSKWDGTGITKAFATTEFDLSGQTAGTEIWVKFSAPNGNLSDYSNALDNLSVIPEPATLGLLGLGAACLVGLRRQMS